MNKKIAFLISLISLSAVVPVLNFFPQWVLPVLYIMILLISVLKNDAIVTNKYVMLFVFAVFISLFLNKIPSYFRSEQRFIFFVVSLSVLSPLIKSHFLVEFKRNTFHYTNVFILIITVLSFLLKVTGIYGGLDWAGGFSGLTNVSMVLSPLSAIALFFAIFQIYKSKGKTRKFFLIAAIISFFTLIISGSRVALFGSVFGVFVFFNSYHKNIGAKFKAITYTFLLILITIPLWSSYLGQLNNKMEYSNSKGSIFATRTSLWQYRYDEFIESPVFGIGYSNSKYGKINTESGVIEPGSSWGVIFAMTGLFGGLVFLSFILSLLKFLYFNEKDKLLRSFLMGLLVFFIINWIAEGYILSAGSYLFYYSWLLLGVIDSNKIPLYRPVKK